MLRSQKNAKGKMYVFANMHHLNASIFAVVIPNRYLTPMSSSRWQNSHVSNPPGAPRTSVFNSDPSMLLLNWES